VKSTGSVRIVVLDGDTGDLAWDELGDGRLFFHSQDGVYCDDLRRPDK
jgi:hypothetical protein